jgi:hypothetical protein
MNTHALELPAEAIEVRRRNTSVNWPLVRIARAMLALLGVLLPAVGIILASVWGFSAETPFMAAATLWAAGLVFFALAVDRPDRTSLWLILSGITIMVLAGLSTAAAAEFGVLGGFLVAGWSASATARSLFGPRRAGAATDHWHSGLTRSS